MEAGKIETWSRHVRQSQPSNVAAVSSLCSINSELLNSRTMAENARNDFMRALAKRTLSAKRLWTPCNALSWQTNRPRGERQTTVIAPQCLDEMMNANGTRKLRQLYRRRLEKRRATGDGVNGCNFRLRSAFSTAQQWRSDRGSDLAAVGAADFWGQQNYGENGSHSEKFTAMRTVARACGMCRRCNVAHNIDPEPNSIITT